MMIHQQDDEAVCREYWRAITGLVDTQFLTTVAKRTSKARKPLPFGTITIRYNSLEPLRLMKADIEKNSYGNLLKVESRKPHLVQRG